MMAALEAKFRQNTDIRRLLLDTASRKILCHYADDAFWGDGPQGNGRNRLGEMLEARIVSQLL